MSFAAVFFSFLLTTALSAEAVTAALEVQGQEAVAEERSSIPVEAALAEDDACSEASGPCSLELRQLRAVPQAASLAAGEAAQAEVGQGKGKMFGPAMDAWQNSKERRQALRKILSGSELVRPASIYDIMSARMAERMGFQVIQLPGSIASHMTLGAPDLGLMTIDDNTQLVRRITRWNSVPLIIDGDNGYGTAIIAMRYIEELELAGVAGVSIEDSVIPGPYKSEGHTITGSAGGFQLTSPEETRDKLKACVEAKTDPETVIMGRSSAYVVNGIDDLAKRLELYRDTGVDAFHIIGNIDKDDWPRVREAAGSLPIMVSGKQECDNKELAEFGVRLRIPGPSVYRASLYAAWNALKAEQESGGQDDDLVLKKTGNRIGWSDISDLLHVDEYMEVQGDYEDISHPAPGTAVDQ